MPLKMKHAKDKFEEEVGEPYRDLYSEQGEDMVLTGIEGVKTQADVDAVKGHLTTEREAHKATKLKLKPWADLDAEEVQTKLDEYDELKASTDGKMDDDKIEELATKRYERKLAPMQRELDGLKTERDEITADRDKLQAGNRRRAVEDRIRTATTESKVTAEHVADALMLAHAVFEFDEESGGLLTKENDHGISAGLSPDAWLTEMQPKRPGWWGPNAGGDAGGSGRGGGGGGANPWRPKSWNVTDQAKLIRADPTRAAQLAKAAGSQIGAIHPPS